MWLKCWHSVVDVSIMQAITDSEVVEVEEKEEVKVYFAAEMGPEITAKFDKLAEGARRTRKAHLEYLIDCYVKDNIDG